MGRERHPSRKDVFQHAVCARYCRRPSDHRVCRFRPQCDCRSRAHHWTESEVRPSDCRQADRSVDLSIEPARSGSIPNSLNMRSGSWSTVADTQGGGDDMKMRAARMYGYKEPLRIEEV